MRYHGTYLLQNMSRRVFTERLTAKNTDGTDCTPEQILGTSLEQELSFASLREDLPEIDLHGDSRDQAIFEIEFLVEAHPGKMVRIIYGTGTGALAEEVLLWLQRNVRGRNPKILGFQEDIGRPSCVVKVR